MTAFCAQVRAEEAAKSSSVPQQQAADAEVPTSYRGTIRYKHAQSESEPNLNRWSLLSCSNTPCRYKPLQAEDTSGCARVCAGLPLEQFVELPRLLKRPQDSSVCLLWGRLHTDHYKLQDGQRMVQACLPS